MKNFVALAAFAAGTNALVGRGDSCCFHVTASGDVSGSLGQLGDGQIRVGDNSLPPSQFCIDSNGAITDNNGRGCIVTAPTDQIQCDDGANATTGFSVNSSGKLQYHGNSGFVACETGQNNGRNIYTKESDSTTQCKKVELSADKCSGNGSGAGGNASGTSSVAPSPAASTEHPATSGPGGPGAGGNAGGSSSVASSPAASTEHPVTGGPGGPGGPGSGASSSVPVPGNSGHPGSGSGASPSAPANTAPLSGSPVTVVSTVTVSDCSCSATGVPGAPVPGGGAPAPSGGAQPSGPAGGGAQPSGPAGGGAQPSGPAGGGAQPSGPAGGGAQTSGPTGGGAQPSGPSGSPKPSGSAGGPQPSQSSSIAIPSGPAASSSTPFVPGASASASRSSPAVSSSMPTPSGPAASSSTPFVPGASASASSSSPAVSSRPSTMSSIPASSASPSSSASRSASGSCPTTLSGSHTSGNYEWPHLIVSVNSSSPDTAVGTSRFGTVSPSVSSIFNFDVPLADAGKTCSLVFLFPKKPDLETADYTFSGNGKMDISKLSDVATASTTLNNMPSVSQDLGQITVSPGNSYLVSTFSCPAGKTVSYEMKDAGDTNLHFFQDWNPSPLGLYITVC